MKAIVSSLLIVLLMATSAFALKDDPEYLRARRSGGKVRLQIKILDDEGCVVTNAMIEVLMGMNFREKSYMVKGVSDFVGSLIVEGETTGNEIEINVRKEGYYDAVKKLCLIEMGHEYAVKDGCWQPWGIEVPLQLRKVRRPTDLVTFNQYITIPTTNTWIGFDMEKKDWKSPYGRGCVADFEVFLNWDGRPQYYTKETSMEIRFAEPFAGCYCSDNVQESAFSGVYRADTNCSYNTSLVISSGSIEGSQWQKGLDESQSLVMRTRCKVDESRELQAANYSTIKNLGISAGWKGLVKLRMRYYYNPVTNSTNLEPKR